MARSSNQRKRRARPAVGCLPPFLARWWSYVTEFAVLRSCLVTHRLSCRAIQMRMGREHPPRISRLSPQQLHERVRRNDRREEIVDTAEGGGLVLRPLARGRVADHDRQITVVARSAGITLDAPIGVNAGDHDGLNALARKVEWQRRADKSGLQRLFAELEIARTYQRAQIVHQIVVRLLFLRGPAFQTGNPAGVLRAVEFALRVLLAE